MPMSCALSAATGPSVDPGARCASWRRLGAAIGLTTVLAAPPVCVAATEDLPADEDTAWPVQLHGAKAPSTQLEYLSGINPVDSEPVLGAGGRLRTWQQVMVWRLRGRSELGWGLAVASGAEGPGGGPLAQQRGASTTSVARADGTSNGSAPLLLLGAGRLLSRDLSMRVGMSVPMARPSTAAVGAANPGDAAGDEPLAPTANQARVGLSLQTRSPLAEWRRGLQLRMELSRSTSLSLKPRRSRVLVELRSQW